MARLGDPEACGGLALSASSIHSSVGVPSQIPEGYQASFDAWMVPS
jgi:hypothetical protein